MKIDLVKNAKRGIKFGLINKVVTLLFPFVVQHILIRRLGLEYVGVKTLFSSVLSVLNLTELGVGASITFCMYKPIAEDNIDLIGSLLCFYRRVYFYIGIVVTVLGIISLPFIKYLIKGTVPHGLNVYVIYSLYLLNSICSYMFFSYKKSLLIAYQRMDVVSNIGSVLSICLCLAQIICLILTRNFYFFVALTIVFTILTNIFQSVLADRMFPEISIKGTVPTDVMKTIKSKMIGIFTGSVCGVTRNTFDAIFISAFLGIYTASLYSNYYMIITILNGFTLVIIESLLGGLGNAIVRKSSEDMLEKLYAIDFAYMLISGWFSICMVVLCQPFMVIYAKGYELFPFSTMILFPIYFYILKMGDVRSVFSDAAGLFLENRNRIIMETIANMFLNLTLVLCWGAFGVMLATIITLFIFAFIGGGIVLFKHYFNKGLKEYFFRHLIYLLSTVTIGCIMYVICSFIDSSNIYINFALRFLVCFFFTPLIYFAIYFKTAYFNELKSLIGVNDEKFI